MFIQVLILVPFLSLTFSQVEKSYGSPPRCNLGDKCKNIACALFVCPYGNDPLACTCCPTCLKGPGDSCGGPNGRCTTNHICVNNFNQPIFSTGPYSPVGKCRSRFCPDCALLDCVPPERLICDKGTIPDSFCGCCPACKKGLNEVCGGPSSTKGACPRKEGLVCKDEKGQEIFPQQSFTPVGRCAFGDGLPIPGSAIEFPPTDNCPNCAALSCALPKCKYGTETDPICGCCPVCKKGLGEKCGGIGNRDGSCGDPFVCENYKCVNRVKPGCLDCRLVKVKCTSPEGLGCPNNYRISTCSCCPECIGYYG